jgi:hypothetical protein
MATNIPTKASGITIQCKINDHEYHEFFTSEGWMIATCYSVNDMARLVTEARDCGFEQGRRHVREAIGIKEKW